MNLKSHGTMGAGYANIVIEMKRPNGQVDRITFHKLFVSDTEDATIDIYEEDDDLIDDLSQAHITRILRQDFSIHIQGTAMPEEGAQLLKVEYDCYADSE